MILKRAGAFLSAYYNALVSVGRSGSLRVFAVHPFDRDGPSGLLTATLANCREAASAFDFDTLAARANIYFFTDF